MGLLTYMNRVCFAARLFLESIFCPWVLDVVVTAGQLVRYIKSKFCLHFGSSKVFGEYYVFDGVQLATSYIVWQIYLFLRVLRVLFNHFTF